MSAVPDIDTSPIDLTRENCSPDDAQVTNNDELNNSSKARMMKKSKVAINYFGEIEFAGLNHLAKYCQMNDKVTEKSIRNSLTKKWDLRPPTLIISIFGTEFEKKRKLKMIFKKGLWKAAESAGCWIVTGGFNLGIMKLAGEAVRDYTDAYGSGRMICIGVAAWDCVYRNDLLEEGLKHKAAPVNYHAQEDDDFCIDPDNTEYEERTLDPNHTHFILSGTNVTNHRRGTEIAFRSKLERAISIWPSDSSQNATENRIPTCGLVVGGDVISLRQIYKSISTNGIPILIVKGTGGTADAIALALTTATDRLHEKKDESKDDYLAFDHKMENILREFYSEYHPDITDFYDDAMKLREIVSDFQHLLSVFDMEEDNDLDGYMISALLSSERLIAGADVPADQLNLDQLQITLTLNRADIAREKIFLENKKWKKGDLNDYMYYALMHDRHEFVKLFLEHNFSLEDFLTVYMLEKLYTEQLKKANSKIAIFQKLWEYHRSHRTNKVMLREVGKVVRILVGDFYHPLYLNKDFQGKLKTKALKKKNMEEIIKQRKKFDKDKKKKEKEEKEKVKEEAKLKKKLETANSKVTTKETALGKDISPEAYLRVSDMLDPGGSSEVTRQSLLEMSYCEDQSEFTPPIQLTEKMLLDRLYYQGMKNSTKTKKDDTVQFQFTKPGKIYIPRTNILLRPKPRYLIKKVNKKERRYKQRNLNASNRNIRVTISEQDMSYKDDSGHTSSDDDQFYTDDALKHMTNLDRPYRELMIWSILVGKLQMAELFWTMEKEPIAGALLASMLLSSMVSRTDDFTDKEDFRNYARHFEIQAEGVLNECYREDEARAQLLINRLLIFYGRSSCIILAAQGQCIRFMAHPCCQDFLTSTWLGRLSSKNSVKRFMFGVISGLSFPILIPKIMLYKLLEEDLISNREASENPDLRNERFESTKRSITTMKDLNLEAGGYFDDDEVQFYPGLENVQRSDKLTCRDMIVRLRQFYMAPVIRFVYNTLSYAIFLGIFSYVLIFDFHIKFNIAEYLLIIWVFSLCMEEVNQAVFSGITLYTYISDGWNKLDCCALSTFITGLTMRSVCLYSNWDSYLANDTHLVFNDNWFMAARCFYALSLFVFFIRMMYFFSFHFSLGPKLIMIGKMIVNDLIPFMIILMVFVAGYGVALQAISYPNGYYTDPETDEAGDPLGILEVLVTFFTRAYFQMFGEFYMDKIEAEDRECWHGKQCPHPVSKILNKFILAFYVLLTNILMFNLLIAMFSRTYEEIESSSTYYWNYQRYEMINEYVNRSPLAPPLILIWHFIKILNFVARCSCCTENDRIDPFCVSFKDKEQKERELVKWEHMKAMDYLRRQGDKDDRDGTDRKRKRIGQLGQFSVRSLSERNTSGTGQTGKEVDDLNETVNKILEKKFKDMDHHFGKINKVDDKLREIKETVELLGDTISTLQESQANVMNAVKNMPGCQCTKQSMDKQGKMRTNLEQYIINAIQSSMNVSPKPGVHQASSTPISNQQLQQLDPQEKIDRRLTARKSQKLPLFQHANQALPKNEVDPRMLPKSEMDSSHRDVISLTEDDFNRRLSGRFSNDTDSDDEFANIGLDKADVIYQPEISNPLTGRIIERQILEHRLWKVYPFNFEHYPGMRTNVPEDKVPWNVSYPEYFAFETDEMLVFPNKSCHDGSRKGSTIPFNTFDKQSRVMRLSFMGKYELDAETNLPLNPKGRTGLKLRGLLPFYGPNHVIIVVVSTLERDITEKVLTRNGKNVMRYISLERAKQFCIPWYFIDHTLRCDVETCTIDIIMQFMKRRLRANYSESKSGKLIGLIQEASILQIYRGYLDDQMNADNAWMEASVFNFHKDDFGKYHSDILKIFSEKGNAENVVWTEVAQSSKLRGSHESILQRVADAHKAFY